MWDILSIILYPAATAILTALLRGKKLILLLILGAVGHLALCGRLCFREVTGNAYLAVNSEQEIVLLLLTSLLYLGVIIYFSRFLHAEAVNSKSRLISGLCLPLFLASMSLVILANNFALLWVAVEATTLASAPLILFHRSKRALEAMWKYLLICSIGIALALLGTLVLALSARFGGVTSLHDFSMTGFLKNSALLSPGWFKAAFVLVIAGYGTKMGLAPFHTWLPDAHSEAPGAVSALLSAGLLNCSFLGIMRFFDVAPDAALEFCRQVMIALGIFSLAVSAFFITRQNDFKRMLAYSSIEHMGLISLMAATVGMQLSLQHMMGHTAIKMALFLLAGNIYLACGTREIKQVQGLFTVLPRNAVSWLIGLLMICGVPPSPLFFTELQLLTLIPWQLALVIALLLFIIFAGMLKIGLNMTMGNCSLQLHSGAKAEKLVYVSTSGLIAALLISMLYFKEVQI